MSSRNVRSQEPLLESDNVTELLLARVRPLMDAIDISEDTPPELLDVSKPVFWTGGANEDRLKINVLFRRGELDQSEFLLLTSYFSKVNAESLMAERTPHRRDPTSP